MELHILNEDTLNLPEYLLDRQGEPVFRDSDMYWKLLKKEPNYENEVLWINKTDTETSGEDGSGDETSGDEDSEAWTMFMAHLNFNEYDAIEKEIKKLGVPYIIAFECSPYDHFHFMVRITEKIYYNFCKRVFKDKYKLRGRASKGLPKQYGHMAKKIESLDKIAKYTIKDKNYRTNLSQKKLEKIINCKIEDVKNTKQDTKVFKQQCLEYCEKHWSPADECIAFSHANNVIEGYGENYRYLPGSNIRILIIQFMINEKIQIRKTTIESYYFYIKQNSLLKGLKGNPYSIFRELYE